MKEEKQYSGAPAIIPQQARVIMTTTKTQSFGMGRTQTALSCLHRKCKWVSYMFGDHEGGRFADAEKMSFIDAPEKLSKVGGGSGVGAQHRPGVLGRVSTERGCRRG